jgi:hypothetical protein
MTLEERRARRRARYENMTEEQRQKRREYQKAWIREHRAAAKASHTALVAPDPPTVQTPAPAAKAIPPSIAKQETVADPVKAQDLESYGDLSPRKAQALQRAWRAEVSEFLLDVLTAPESPLTGAGMRSSKMLCLWMGLGEKLDSIVEHDRPDATAEYILAVLLECLRRLSGEVKTGTAPALPKVG